MECLRQKHPIYLIRFAKQESPFPHADSLSRVTLPICTERASDRIRRQDWTTTRRGSFPRYSKDTGATNQTHFPPPQSTAEGLRATQSRPRNSTFVHGRPGEMLLTTPPPCTPRGLLFSLPLTLHLSTQSSFCSPVQQTQSNAPQTGKALPFFKAQSILGG